MLKIKEYIKNHKFNTIVVLLLLSAVSIEFIQFKIIAKNYLFTLDNQKQINELGKYTENLNSSMNSRIDILDNSVKLDEKRRMLIKKIRDAIAENTNVKMDIRTLNRIAMSTIDQSYEYNISISKLLAQMKVESDFNYRAVSVAGAQGLLQLMPGTRQYLALKMKNPSLNAFDIADNVAMGCNYMAEQIATFGNWELALHAYNAGPDMVKKVKAGILKKYPDETEKYVPEVVKWNEVFKRYGLE